MGKVCEEGEFLQEEDEFIDCTEGPQGGRGGLLEEGDEEGGWGATGEGGEGDGVGATGGVKTLSHFNVITNMQSLNQIHRDITLSN